MRWQNHSGLSRSFVKNGVYMLVMLRRTFEGDALRWHCILERPLSDGQIDSLMDPFLEEFARASSTVAPLTGKTPVILTPNAIAQLIGIVERGLSASNVNTCVSPLAGRMGEQVLSETITVRDDPTYR